MDVVRALDDAGIDAVDINRRQATLDDVFLDPHRPDRIRHDDRRSLEEAVA